MKNCGNCKHYQKETDYVGQCFTVNQFILIDNPVPEAQDFSGHNRILVRSEFGCNKFESK